MRREVTLGSSPVFYCKSLVLYFLSKHISQAGWRANGAEKELLSSQPETMILSLFSHNILGKTAHPHCCNQLLAFCTTSSQSELRYEANVSLERSVILPIANRENFTRQMTFSEWWYPVCSLPQTDVQMCVSAHTCVYEHVCEDQGSVPYLVILHLRFWDRSLNGTWSWPMWLGWLVSKPPKNSPGSASLSAKDIDVYHHNCLAQGAGGSNSDAHTLSHSLTETSLKPQPKILC